jgi:hypothetical protein
MVFTCIVAVPSAALGLIARALTVLTDIMCVP